MRVLTTVALFGLKCDFQLEIEACLSTQLLNVKYDELKEKRQSGLFVCLPLDGPRVQISTMSN